MLMKLLGFALFIFGVYTLGENIIFTSQVYPYFWRGLSADLSILCLSSGIFCAFMLPKHDRDYAWILIGLGILLVFLSSLAILRPTTLWQFFVGTSSLAWGFNLMKGKKSFY